MRLVSLPRCAVQCRATRRVFYVPGRLFTEYFLSEGILASMVGRSEISGQGERTGTPPSPEPANEGATQKGQ